MNISNMNFSDKLFLNLSELGVDYCGCVSGGGIMYLLDAVGRNQKITTKYFHHEQSAGIAAEAYSKAKNISSICLVTIGPGVANAISAAFSAFINSVPVIFISGAKRSTVSTNYQLERFTFPQDADTRSLVSGVVKGYWELSGPENLDSVVKAAFNLANSGRPGPVWLSVPLDTQGKKVSDFNSFSSFKDEEKNHQIDISKNISDFLSKSKRTVVIAGDGINSVIDDIHYQYFVKNLGLPFITSIGSNHTINCADNLNIGTFGPTGRRAANIALTYSDSIIALGTGLDIDLTGFDRQSFFQGKKVLSFNKDPNLHFHEVKDSENFTVDLFDVDFSKLSNIQHAQNNWAEACLKINELLSVKFEVNHHQNDLCDAVDPYLFSQLMVDKLPEKTGITAGISLDVVALSHSAKLKKGHRLYISKHCGQLGWDIPACIGVAHTDKFDQVICVTGDGSIMFNLQDLATLSKVKQKVGIFIYDNDGYNSIRTSQKTHLDGRLFGSTLDDLSFPDWGQIASAFGFNFFCLESNSDISQVLDESLKEEKFIVVIKVDPNRSRTPRLVSKIVEGKFVSPRLSEQYPFLSERIQNQVDKILAAV